MSTDDSVRHAQRALFACAQRVIPGGVEPSGARVPRPGARCAIARAQGPYFRGTPTVGATSTTSVPGADDPRAMVTKAGLRGPVVRAPTRRSWSAGDETGRQLRGPIKARAIRFRPWRDRARQAHRSRAGYHGHADALLVIGGIGLATSARQSDQRRRAARGRPAHACPRSTTTCRPEEALRCTACRSPCAMVETDRREHEFRARRGLPSCAACASSAPSIGALLVRTRDDGLSRRASGARRATTPA